ncbi:hypothetical protein KDX27_14470 [Burkholderia cenocepacia]|uniref:Uncharacterized protein n=2 Tax=Burkholderia cenocepacia TaxID=95486 RepID=A0ABD4U676_9BURK|nr:hypothetical protein [Burkholderia cenocepacia]MBR8024698.1 hypothetical protein [Burkholderia cenocepacia]MBR8168921.1 hypothetical protein [Burkholderia cenocepacia]MBR8425099.1 hypothetical protein [Burkholderia cenocepacia]MBU9654209.1 hypothetical protein [Burkholderia cenocepacia]MCW3694262.1 hypothetical protein [Burkholderia cenocepacia]
MNTARPAPAQNGRSITSGRFAFRTTLTVAGATVTAIVRHAILSHPAFPHLADAQIRPTLVEALRGHLLITYIFVF